MSASIQILNIERPAHVEVIRGQQQGIEEQVELCDECDASFSIYGSLRAQVWCNTEPFTKVKRDNLCIGVAL